MIIAGMNNFKMLYKQLINDYNVKIIYDDTYNILNNSNFTASYSFTWNCNLGNCFFKVPQIVCYKSSWFSFLIAKSFIKLNTFLW